MLKKSKINGTEKIGLVTPSPELLRRDTVALYGIITSNPMWYIVLTGRDKEGKGMRQDKAVS